MIGLDCTKSISTGGSISGELNRMMILMMMPTLVMLMILVMMVILVTLIMTVTTMMTCGLCQVSRARQVGAM